MPIAMTRFFDSIMPHSGGSRSQLAKSDLLRLQSAVVLILRYLPRSYLRKRTSSYPLILLLMLLTRCSCISYIAVAMVTVGGERPVLDY
jgi:hypothetical protein